MFVLVADNEGADEFYSYSNYGADGEGSTGTATFQFKGFTGYFLKVFGSEAASVNKFIIIPTDSNVEVDFDASNEEGTFKITDAKYVRRIFYFLFANEPKVETTDEKAEEIF